MLQSISLILIFQLAGELISRWTGIPVPGPVIGMLLMLAAFFIKDDLIDIVRPTAGALLSNLSLLFVPAGVGIMMHVDRFMSEGLGIALTLVLSSIIAMAAAAAAISAACRILKISEDD